MNRFLVFISVILATTIGNISNAVAQAHSKLEGTIWEYVWDDEMRRDFIAFVSDDKALSYSLEVNEFEISDYYINDDTIIVTTSNIDNTQ